MRYLIVLLFLSGNLCAQHGTFQNLIAQPVPITLVSIDTIESSRVPVGTAFGDINFDDYGRDEVRGLLSNGSIVTIPITWAAGSYNSATPGVYSISGSLSPPIFIANYTITPSTTVEVVDLEAELDAVITQANTDGDALPTPINLGDINELILNDKNAGVFSTRDVYYIMLTDGSTGFARINYKTPSANKATIVGGVTYTSRVGFTGNGTTGYLNTNFNTSSATNYLQNDAGIGVYAYTGAVRVGSVATGARITLSTATTVPYEINGNTNPTYVIGYPTGYHHLWRSVSGSINAAVNSISEVTATADVSVARPNANIYILARNNAGVADLFTSGTVSCFWAGANLGASREVIYLNWQKYLRRAMIKPVYTPGIIGVKLNDDFARAALGAAYTVASGTWACDGAELDVSGGANDFLKKCSWKYGNSSEYTTISVNFRMTSVPGANMGFGYGFADYASIGGERSIVARMDLSNGANAGKALIYTWDGTTAVLVGTAATAIPTLTDEDSFTSTLVKDISGGSVRFVFTVTRGSDVTTVSYSNMVGNSTGDIALWTFGTGATQSVTLLNVNFQDSTGYKLNVIGNSLAHGVSATDINDSYARNLSDSSTVSAGPGDGTVDVVGSSLVIQGKIQNLIDYNSQYYGLAIGGNDVAGAVPTATWENNIKKTVYALLNQGYKVILISPPPRNDADLSVIGTFYTTFFPQYVKIDDTYNSVLGTGTDIDITYDSGDGVHLNTAGHLVSGAAGRAQMPVLY